MIDWDALPLGKGPTRKSLMAAKKRRERDIIRETRALVWERDRSCRYTRVARDDDEMHEIVSRAHTRGMAPEQRFNTRNCVRLSRETHRAVTEHRLTIECGPDGADGTLEFVEHADEIAVRRRSVVV